jgi:AraC family L-rhamnose operon transcriptional activator RhaR
MTTIPGEHFTELRSLSLTVPLGGFSAQIRGWGFYEPAWWRNYLHIHSFFEVCYAFAGRGLFHINGHNHEVAAGQVFVARPGEPHEIISSEEEPLGIYFWSYTLIPPSQRQTDTDTLLHAFLTTPRSVSADTPAMGHTIELLTGEITRREAGYEQAIHALVMKLLLDTARAVTDLPPVVSEGQALDSSETLVQDMRRYLRDNYQRPVRVRDVAAQVHLSERHTNRLFGQVMGMSIKAYLTQYRLEVAAQHLVSQQMSVTEVAYASGYRDVRHFITRFRQHTGLTPTAFRAQGGTRFLDSSETT